MSRKQLKSIETCGSADADAGPRPHLWLAPARADSPAPRRSAPRSRRSIRVMATPGGTAIGHADGTEAA